MQQSSLSNRKSIQEKSTSLQNEMNEELIDNDEFQEKLDGLTNQFHIKYDDFKQKINVIKHETEEGITNLQTELETTGNEVKTNTAERIRIAESISSVKRDLDILSSQLASNILGRSLAAELRAAKSRL